MSFPKSLLTGTGCAPDGQVSQNPINHLMDAMLHGPQGQMIDGRMQGPAGQLEDAWEGAEVYQHPEVWQLEQAYRDEAPPHEAAWAEEFHQEQEMERAFQENDEQAMKDTTSLIMASLQQQDDPKFRNSEFFKFVSKLNSGELKIADNQLVPGDMESAWKAAEEGEMEAAWQEKPMEEAWEHAQMDAAWDHGENEDDEILENPWGAAGADELAQAWSRIWSTEAPKASGYTFSEANPYADSADPFSLAQTHISTGDIPEAILALEAEVQRHPDSSEAWRLLGQLHAENDEDAKAIAALIRCYEIDPYNLDSLIALGISCTNELDEQKALEHLKSWLQNNPDYSGIPAPEVVDREGVKGMYSMAEAINPMDADVCMAVGVLNFMSRNFEEAADAFTRAIEQRPRDHSLWNKLGATLANKGDSDQALAAYHKALDLKPSYVRAWVNLGIAYGNIVSTTQRDYDRAARFYLCALALNPEAQHVWSYLTSTFISMDRADLVRKVELRDPMVFQDEFHVITRKELPGASNELGADEWVREFQRG